MKKLISFIKGLLAFFLADFHPELDETHAATRYAMQERKDGERA
jgi:hypothetical protein